MHTDTQVNDIRKLKEHMAVIIYEEDYVSLNYHLWGEVGLTGKEKMNLHILVKEK